MELRLLSDMHVLLVCASFFGASYEAHFKLSTEHLNKRLLCYTIDSYDNIALEQCARKCLFVKQCASINYCISSRVCELNAIGSDNAPSTDFVKDNKWNYADNTAWPKVMAGTCENNNCGQNQECLPAQPEAICVSLPGCPILQPIGNSKLKPGGTLVNTTRTYTCDTGYVATDGAPTIVKVCQGDGTWTNEGSICYAPISQWVSSVANYSSQYSPNGWSAAQVIGAYDTYPAYGDIVTSWAPRTRDANQFLEVEYEIAVFITSVDIYETYHSGGVKRVSARDSDGTLHVLWETTEVTDMGQSRIFSPPLQMLNYTSILLRVDIDCTVANSWVEIDAIRLHGRQ